MDEHLKEELVERFRTYLETDFDPETEVEPEDQYSLFSELSGLKNEVRLESRQLKTALDDFREAFSALDGSNSDLTEMFLQLQVQQQERQKKSLKPIISGLMDLYDSLAAGLKQKPPKPNMLELFCQSKQNKQWLQAHQEGQRMTLGRVIDLLDTCEVTPIEVTDKPFDPSMMKAVQLESDPDREDGLVLDEFRKGFISGSKVIRSAEVVVNKKVVNKNKVQE